MKSLKFVRFAPVATAFCAASLVGFGAAWAAQDQDDRDDGRDRTEQRQQTQDQDNRNYGREQTDQRQQRTQDQDSSAQRQRTDRATEGREFTDREFTDREFTDQRQMERRRDQQRDTSGRTTQQGRRTQQQETSYTQDEEQPSLGVMLVPGQQGLYVTHVVSGGPAEQAGLRRGDEISEVDGQRVRSVEELIRVLGERDTDEQIELTIIREGQERFADVSLESRREAFTVDPNEQQQYTQRQQRQSGQAYSRQDQQQDFFGRGQQEAGQQQGRQQDRFAQQDTQWQSQLQQQMQNLQQQIAQLQQEVRQLRSEVGAQVGFRRDGVDRREFDDSYDQTQQRTGRSGDFQYQDQDQGRSQQRFGSQQGGRRGSQRDNR